MTQSSTTNDVGVIEKTITLDNTPLVDFFGPENQNINEIAAAFPESRILSRGNQIKLKGAPAQVIRINDIINNLLNYLEEYGQLKTDIIKSYLKQENTGLEADNSVVVYGNKGLVVRPRTPNQAQLVDTINANDVVFAIGPAGTGKTYISVAMAVKALKNKAVKKIIITRPAVEAGENLGFLPGDLQEKIDPYLRPIYDALDDMIPAEKLKYFQENRIVEIAPLAYMRGRTLNDAFILLDEAQNTTPMQLKMFLTRMGPKSKMIVTGDMSQVDLPNRQQSGLIDATHKLKDIKGIGFVRLTTHDVVRHQLVKEIIAAYDAPDNKTTE